MFHGKSVTSRPDITDLNNKNKDINNQLHLMKYFSQKRGKFKTFITTTIIQNP